MTMRQDDWADDITKTLQPVDGEVHMHDAALALRNERERCAKIVEDIGKANGIRFTLMAQTIRHRKPE